MKVEHWCNMTVAAAEADVGVLELAQMMREHDVSQVVIIREAGTLVTPIGMVTDRDLALKTLIEGTDIFGLTARDVMSRQLLTVLGSDELDAALAAMRSRKVSRAPVVDEEGALVGILLLRDVLASMANMTVEMFAHDGPGAIEQARDNAQPISIPDHLSLQSAVPTRVARYQEDWVTFDFQARARRHS